MAPPGPGLLTIPREIRDQIWELLYIKKKKKQDPDRPSSYPHMKSAIYLTNRQLSEEHKQNLLQKDKRINKVIYEEAVAYTCSIADVLKCMIFVMHHMRKQTVQRHNILGLYVDSSEHGIFLGDSEDEAGKDESSKKDFNEEFDSSPFGLAEEEEDEEFMWKGPEKELHFGWLYLKVDVYELSLLECTGNLVAPLEAEKRVRLALNAIRDSTLSDGRDRGELWTFKQFAAYMDEQYAAFMGGQYGHYKEERYSIG